MTQQSADERPLPVQRAFVISSHAESYSEAFVDGTSHAEEGWGVSIAREDLAGTDFAFVSESHMVPGSKLSMGIKKGVYETADDVGRLGSRWHRMVLGAGWGGAG